MVKEDDKYFCHRIVMLSKVTALIIGSCDDFPAEVSIILTQQQSFSSLSHSLDVSVSRRNLQGIDFGSIPSYLLSHVVNMVHYLFL